MMKVRESKKKKKEILYLRDFQPNDDNLKTTLKRLKFEALTRSCHIRHFCLDTQASSFPLALQCHREKKHDLEKAQNEKKTNTKVYFFSFNLIGILHIYRVISYTQSNPLNSSVIFLLKKVQCKRCYLKCDRCSKLGV